MKEKVMPYVVSQDIYVLLEKWCQSKKFVLPSIQFFSLMRKDFDCYLQQIFHNVDILSENELTTGINRIVDQTGLCPVSLDKSYYDSQFSIEITREVDELGCDLGITNRFGTKLINQQIQEIKDRQIKEVILVDDVIFNGDTVEKVICLLEQNSIKVSLVCSGIVIGRGKDRLMKSKKVEVLYVKKYEQVIDEVCERDFYPGVPFSGRTLVGGTNIGVPYILPFGNPGKWASIPTEWQSSFSRFCIDQTIMLFKEIEKNSKKEIMCDDLDRNVKNVSQEKIRFVDQLKSITIK